MTLSHPPEEASAPISDARPGDRWCTFCRWLIIQEVVEDQDLTPLECPTHGSLHQG
jgi:hypothetical protein